LDEVIEKFHSHYFWETFINFNFLGSNLKIKIWGQFVNFKKLRGQIIIFEKLRGQFAIFWNLLGSNWIFWKIWGSKCKFWKIISM